MSEYGEEVDAILAKAGKDWSKSDFAIINSLIKDGHRVRLKQVLRDVRGGDKPA